MGIVYLDLLQNYYREYKQIIYDIIYNYILKNIKYKHDNKDIVIFYYILIK